jgi:glycosyltransferase involved in cell wall biosynthesis
MIRLLHLHDARPDFQTARAVDAHLRKLAGDFEVDTRTIGQGGDFANLASAALGLRAEARRCDLVHAWGSVALAAAAFARFGRIIFTPTVFPSRRQLRWLRAVMSFRDVNVVCPSATMQRMLVERGIPSERCHLIRPGVDFSRIKAKRDPALRAALGFGEADQVLLGVGESTVGANHRQLVWTGTILNVLDRSTRVLLWGRGPRARSAANFATQLAQPELVKLAEQKLGRSMDFEELLPAADMIVISATRPVATLPVAIAMAAALPIVATVTPTIAELLEDRHTALMTQPDTPRLLALRIREMRQDPQLQWKLADTARTEAYEYFSQTRFIEESGRFYEQLIKNSVPQLAGH